jgi:ArsR family transcriptional regulator
MAAVPSELVDEAARRFRLLADPTRLRLLNALHDLGELSVSGLAERTGTGLANTSKHLTMLERERLVARRRDGTTVYYRIADPTLVALCDLVCTSVRDRFAELGRIGSAPPGESEAA